MAEKLSKADRHYGIGAVAKMTGLTDHTIRVWERRYGAVKTQRLPNGHRVYSATDVEKLGILKRLTDQGLAIGQIAASSVEQLREQVERVSGLSAAAVPEHIGLAVLGENLPSQLKVHDRDLSPLDVRIADNNSDRFAADLGCQHIDLVILESPVLNTATTEQVLDYMGNSGADRGIIIYSFARTRDVELARRSNIVVLRGPVDVDQLHAAVMQSFTQAFVARPKPEKQPGSGATEWGFADEIAPRLFNQQQLSILANTSSAIDCECPKHLAQLVCDLSAFEIYSANCANRDDDDAALHHYLHHTTARARALIEIALEKVADAEGLEY